MRLRCITRVEMIYRLSAKESRWLRLSDQQCDVGVGLLREYYQSFLSDECRPNTNSMMIGIIHWLFRVSQIQMRSSSSCSQNRDSFEKPYHLLVHVWCSAYHFNLMHLCSSVRSNHSNDCLLLLDDFEYNRLTSDVLQQTLILALSS
ncbi:hypothetical protein TNCT_294341 [Trichonephila clavata]|uniref:Uncharacterized protein n=1 Tax=Trichonephila clavata TaxID=2740835 RepID=A0A8X6M660_TRICU|nr:hypothetical protein TNCT_294341 [Trichonephila clavata]